MEQSDSVIVPVTNQIIGSVPIDIRDTQFGIINGIISRCLEPIVVFTPITVLKSNGLTANPPIFWLASLSATLDEVGALMSILTNTPFLVLNKRSFPWIFKSVIPSLVVSIQNTSDLPLFKSVERTTESELPVYTLDKSL
ncbi:hypothetical protein WICPIJ_004699 [Wickerhamomyces pijperi]|uniref:Uncharacterized protein n=1 Tax=Wickerhamomyces pijperi TaxID=599730 RepID=A0A9P8TMM6_WICPI|nr:hypothetical protein WICPIJ_004699 [Wickerhamomyces pijperi]